LDGWLPNGEEDDRIQKEERKRTQTVYSKRDDGFGFQGLRPYF